MFDWARVRKDRQSTLILWLPHAYKNSVELCLFLFLSAQPNSYFLRLTWASNWLKKCCCCCLRAANACRINFSSDSHSNFYILCEANSLQTHKSWFEQKFNKKRMCVTVCAIAQCIRCRTGGYSYFLLFMRLLWLICMLLWSLKRKLTDLTDECRRTLLAMTVSEQRQAFQKKNYLRFYF